LTIGLLVALVGCSQHSSTKPASGPSASDLTTHDALLAWMKANPDHVGLVIRRDGHEEFVFHPDTRFALASTKKVLTLLALADRISSGKDQATARVALSDVDRWYLPGLDGGHHNDALAELRSQGKVTTTGGAETVALADVAWAMIRWSDNAAADYLLDRVGGFRATDAVAAKFGMTHQEPVLTIYSEDVAWAIEGNRWSGMSPSARATEAERLAAATPVSRARQLRLTSANLVALVQTDTGGTPREWARLMEQLPPPSSSDSGVAMLTHSLGWPLIAFPTNGDTFSTFYAKGGSLPGVATDVLLVVPVKEAKPYALALFFKDLPIDVYAQLQKTYVQQDFMRQLALDPAFRKKVEQTL
jgi:D-alanyl-D-alanine carboxypeptidase